MRRKSPLHIAATALLVCASTTQAALYTVNSNADLPDADPTDSACATPPPMPVCTLRAAVMQANAHPGLDYINVPAGTYVLTRVGYDQTANFGDLDVTDDLQIIATGSPTIIDANGAVTADRAFEVVSGSLTLQGITIKNGNTPSYGGAIYAQGNLTLTDVSILDNNAALDGGGVYATADVNVDTSLVRGNISQGYGGGIRVTSSGTASVTVTGSEFADNHAENGDDGGGLAIEGANAQIDGAWFHDNSAREGGGMSYSAAFVGLQLQMTNSTFDHNTATASGGGLYSYGNDTISNTAFTNNSADEGGGMYGYYGTHSLIDVRASHNDATYFGGGLLVTGGNLSVRRGQIDHNTATQSGGGILAGGLGTITLTLNDSTVFNNSAGDGGGVYANMEFVSMTSTIYHNNATRGGGVFVEDGETTIDDSTISSNIANTYGGGVFVDATGSLKLNSATLADNTAHTSLPGPGTGGALYITASALAVANATVFSGNRASLLVFSFNDCAGALTLGNNNFMTTNAGCTIGYASGAVGNQVGGAYPSILNASLSPLLRLYNTAPTSPPLASPKFGHVPLTGSPLIDAGPSGGCKAGSGGGLSWDLIGQPRALGARCDIGAVEFGAAIDGIFADGYDG